MRASSANGERGIEVAVEEVVGSITWESASITR
jgi:hypothetical protein